MLCAGGLPPGGAVGSWARTGFGSKALCLIMARRALGGAGGKMQINPILRWANCVALITPVSIVAATSPALAEFRIEEPGIEKGEVEINIEAPIIGVSRRLPQQPKR